PLWRIAVCVGCTSRAETFLAAATTRFNDAANSRPNSGRTRARRSERARLRPMVASHVCLSGDLASLYCKACQDASPAPFRLDACVKRLRLGASLDIAMLKFDARTGWTIGNEPHLDLARASRIWIELESAIQMPGQHDARRRFIDQHAAPIAF